MTDSSDRRKEYFFSFKHSVQTGNWDKVCRNKETEESYRLHRTRVLEKWNSMDDFIMHTIFDRPINKDLSSSCDKLRICWPLENDILETKFTANSFPYVNKELGIEHSLLWSTQRLSVEQIESAIQKEKPPTEWEYFYWENPPSMKSIHHVFHIHIVSTRKY